MPPEAKKWTKVSRSGRSKGVKVMIDQRTWEHALKESRIPLDTPLDQLRVTRYMTNGRNIIIRVKMLKDIPVEDR